MAKNSAVTGNDRGLANVLVARFSALGDVAMTVPVVYSACRCYPDVRFILVTRPSMTGIFVDPPANLVLVGVDLRRDYPGVRGMRRLLGELVDRYHIDAFVDLHNVLRTRIMAFFCRLRGIPVSRMFKARANRRALTRCRNKVMLPLVSQHARYNEAFFKIGLPLIERFSGLYDGRGTAPVDAFAAITPPKAPGMRWIGIAPFAAHVGKIYPVGLMEKVVDRLAAEPDVEIFLFGGGDDEREILDTWAARHPNVRSLAGKQFGFRAELALFNHIDVVLTMDSANMHLAAIAGTRTVSIWGATHPYCGFSGWRQSDADTLQSPMTCRPCSVFGDKACRRGDYMCLAAIRPDTVVKKVLATK